MNSEDDPAHDSADDPAIGQALHRPLVVHVVSGMAVGGVARVVLEICRHGRDNFRFHVICTEREGRWAEELRAMSVGVSRCRCKPAWWPVYWRRVSKEIQRLKADAVHLHNPPNTAIAGLWCRRAGVPYAILYQNVITRYLNRFAPVVRWLERRVVSGAAAVQAVSKAVADSAALGMQIPIKRIEVVHNGVDVPLFAGAREYDPRQEWGLEPGRPIAVLVGRLVEFKGIPDFAHAARLVLDHWQPGARPKPAFVVIGDGGLRAEVERLIAELGLQHDMILAGTREDVPAILKSCQVGVSSSPHSEGCALVLFEYMAAGLPIVATGLDSVTELMSDGDHALLSPPNDPSSLARNMEALLRQPDLAARLADRARAEVLPAHDWQDIVVRYTDLYARMTNAHARRATTGVIAAAPPSAH